MNKLRMAIALIPYFVATATGAFAGERTITLAVKNMACVVCAYSVKKSLEAVSGVSKVRVSLRDMKAIVTYDDMKTDINTLTSATAGAGFPSAPVN